MAVIKYRRPTIPDACAEIMDRLTCEHLKLIVRVVQPRGIRRRMTKTHMIEAVMRALQDPTRDETKETIERAREGAKDEPRDLVLETRNPTAFFMGGAMDEAADVIENKVQKRINPATEKSKWKPAERFVMALFRYGYETKLQKDREYASKNCSGNDRKRPKYAAYGVSDCPDGYVEDMSGCCVKMHDIESWDVAGMKRKADKLKRAKEDREDFFKYANAGQKRLQAVMDNTTFETDEQARMAAEVMREIQKRAIQRLADDFERVMEMYPQDVCEYEEWTDVPKEEGESWSNALVELIKGGAKLAGKALLYLFNAVWYFMSKVLGWVWRSAKWMAKGLVTKAQQVAYFIMTDPDKAIMAWYAATLVRNMVTDFIVSAVYESTILHAAEERLRYMDKKAGLNNFEAYIRTQVDVISSQYQSENAEYLEKRDKMLKDRVNPKSYIVNPFEKAPVSGLHKDDDFATYAENEPQGWLTRTGTGLFGGIRTAVLGDRAPDMKNAKTGEKYDNESDVSTMFKRKAETVGDAIVQTGAAIKDTAKSAHKEIKDMGLYHKIMMDLSKSGKIGEGIKSVTSAASTALKASSVLNGGMGMALGYAVDYLGGVIADVAEPAFETVVVTESQLKAVSSVMGFFNINQVLARTGSLKARYEHMYWRIEAFNLLMRSIRDYGIRIFAEGAENASKFVARVMSHDPEHYDEVRKKTKENEDEEEAFEDDEDDDAFLEKRRSSTSRRTARIRVKKLDD